MSDHAARRQRMVTDQLVDRGITDDRVLAAMGTVPRHDFVPRSHHSEAYSDRPLPIGHGVTISQPFIVAFMSAALELEGHERVLEIGAGSGYAAAVLAELAAEVITVEFIPELATSARRLLADRPNVTVVEGDGSLGWPDSAPYDGIVVTAAAAEIPPPLLDQLGVGGRLVIPIGRGHERLIRVRRTPDGFEREALLDVRFVPLRGEHGR